MLNNKSGTIELREGPRENIERAKSGHLVVVRRDIDFVEK